MQGCSKGLITLEVAEDAWEVVGWDWGGGGGVPIPGGVAVGKPSLRQDPSQIMLWVMSC